MAESSSSSQLPIRPIVNVSNDIAHVKEDSNIKRLNQTIEKPFIYGNITFWLGKKAHSEKSHQWNLFLRGLQNEDLSYFIKKVTFQLHPTFPDPVRVFEKPPYMITETGWGEFQIGIKVEFLDENEPPVELIHVLKLFPTNSAMSMRKPVISEHYDEFVFVNPTENFGNSLLKGPSAWLDDPTNTIYQYFKNDSIFEDELKAKNKLESALITVYDQIEVLKKSYFETKAEIASLQAQLSK